MVPSWRKTKKFAAEVYPFERIARTALVLCPAHSLNGRGHDVRGGEGAGSSHCRLDSEIAAVDGEIRSLMTLLRTRIRP